MMNLSRLNEQPKKILDIGCNVGQFYRFAKGLWPSSDFFLIDGNDSVEEDIKTLNVPYKITLLSDSIKEVTLYKNPLNLKCTGTSIYRENTEHYVDAIEEIKQTETLDDLFPNQTFDLIKIDTQGSEIDILNGGLLLLQRTKYVILETSLIEWNINSPDENEMISYMDSKYFKVVDVIGSHFLGGNVIQHDILFKNNLL